MARRDVFLFAWIATTAIHAALVWQAYASHGARVWTFAILGFAPALVAGWAGLAAPGGPRRSYLALSIACALAFLGWAAPQPLDDVELEVASGIALLVVVPVMAIILCLAGWSLLRAWPDPHERPA